MLSPATSSAMFVAQQTPAKPGDLIHKTVSDRNKRTLTKQLSVLPQNLVKLMSDSELTIKVAQGQSTLAEIGAISPFEAKDLMAKAPEDLKILDSLQKVPHGTRELDAEISRSTEGRWQLRRPSSKPKDSEMSLRELAESQGLKSESDIRWYIDNVYEANSENIDVLQFSSIGKLTRETRKGGRKGRKAREKLVEYSTPDGTVKDDAIGKIPFRLRGVRLAVPNWHRVKLGSDRLDLSLHDKQTVERWTQGFNSIEPQENFLGQYFGQGETNMILLAPKGLQRASTVIHEVGHAVERLAQKNSPEQYYEFFSRLEQAHDGIKPSGAGRAVDPDRGSHHDGLGRKQISAYSRTNAKEYFAEGFAHYIQDGESLKKDDPLLYKLVEEGIRLAQNGSDVDLKLSQ